MGKLGWAVATAFMVGGCGGDETQEDVPDPTYDNFGTVFLEQYCTRCHTPAGATPVFALGDRSVDRAAFEDIADAARCGVSPEVLPECGVQDPPAGSLPAGAPSPTDRERRRFVEWVDAGLP